MRRKVIQDFANTVAAMAVSDRLRDDLESLAELPDGIVEVDLLGGAARHAEAGPVELNLTSELFRWLEGRLVQSAMSCECLDEALVELEVRTDRVPTDKKRIVLFELCAKTRLATDEKCYEGVEEGLLWHTRLASQQ